VFALGTSSLALCLGLALDIPGALVGAVVVGLTLVVLALRSSQAAAAVSMWARVCGALMLCTFWPLVAVLAYAVSPLALYRVPSTSMEPTIMPGDLLIVDSWAYTRTLPERGDIVVFMAPGAEPREYVKRVVGLPKEPLRIAGHRTFVAGRPVSEPYARIGPTDPTLLEQPDRGPLWVAPGHLYVLGDNRTHSVDSRSFGPVPFPLVRGRVLWIVWPFAHRAALSPFRS
jgi:signal peptidase I